MYCESVQSSTSQGSFRAERASMTARSSMRLFVVSRSPPESSFSRPMQLSMAAQPPGPGLPEQAPSVYMQTFFIIIPRPRAPCGPRR